MKKYSTGIAALCMITALMLSAAAYGQSQNEFTVPLSDPAKRAKIKVHINSGSVSIKGTTRKDVLVRYRSAEDPSAKEATKNGLKRIGGEGIDLEVAEESNNMKILSGSWNSKLALEVEVPAGADLDVKTYNDGDLSVDNIQGEVVLTNYNGAITALGVSGSAVATTYNGDVKVTFNKVTPDTPMSFSTYNGDIDIALPSAQKASVKLKTEQGDIYSDFDLTFKKPEPVQQKDAKGGVYRVVVEDWKRGDINGGGSEITIKNYNGDIFVRRKQ